MATIILTGGGTAGHCTPNLALLPYLKNNFNNIVYVGSKNGIERSLAEQAKLPYYSIPCAKLNRTDFKSNLTMPLKVISGIIAAGNIIDKIKPDVIFSKGGYVAVPVVIAASLKKIPVVSHESDLTPGLANKLSAPFCNKLCVTFRESLDYIKEGKGALTGTPIRSEILKGSKVKGKEICGFNDNKDTLLVIGGSLGARSINDEVRRDLNEILVNFNVIHICGKGNLDQSLNSRKGYKQFEYVKEDLPHLLQAADFIISRAGANVIFELLALKKPTLLIPLSKKISRGDQILNANSFEKEGYSLVLDEDEMMEKHNLIDKLTELKNNKNKLVSSMQNSKVKNGVDEIINVILNSLKR
jgi:UDP-N-acetylglucosamine--N-acetylmuramyl-(pentapeptide) pyrophosphoryl-undecaprenol N-acetylglucosamine transferase